MTWPITVIYIYIYIIITVKMLIHINGSRIWFCLAELMSSELKTSLLSQKLVGLVSDFLVMDQELEGCKFKFNLKILEFSRKWTFNCMEVLEEMAVERKGFIVSLCWWRIKNLLQKLLKDDCIYWRLEPVLEDIRVLLRRDFGNVLKYKDGEYWSYLTPQLPNMS